MMDDIEQKLRGMIASDSYQQRPPGMYLFLYHGRKDPDIEMEGWGKDGPVFGPLKYCAITYMNTINLCGINDDEGTGPMVGSDPMHISASMIYYDGWYYGDWSLDYEGDE